MELLKDLIAGQEKACARCLSLVENHREGYLDLLEDIYPYLGRAYKVALTGPPGVGKSTLIAGLVEEYIKLDKKIGLLLVSPSSPVSQGTFLGDRISLAKFFTHPNVFIRSVASRGMEGGLAPEISSMIKILDAYGCDLILLETVGSCPLNTEVLDLVDCLVNVLNPDIEDELQLMETGNIELGDILVLNKLDDKNLERVKIDLEMILDLREDEAYRSYVLVTSKNPAKGIGGLRKALDDHKTYLETSGMWEKKRLQQKEKEVYHWMQNQLEEKLRQNLRNQEKEVIEALKEGESPYKVALDLLERDF